MAVCEIWDVRGRLDHPIDYAENPEKTANPKYTEDDLQAMVDVMEYATNKDKTEQRFFVTGVSCDPTTARDEMMITKAGWSDTSEIVCYHGFQSFKHGEVTPEQAHEVGVKLAERMWGDRFQVIVATHLNTDCLHNHFVVNSVSFADLPVALAHETNHNVRFQFIKWRNDITLGEMMVSEGLAENFATYLYGEDKAGPWVKKTDMEWQLYITEHFYQCDKQILSSLGKMYVTDLRFSDFINRFGNGDLAVFFSKAIEIFCSRQREERNER